MMTLMKSEWGRAVRSQIRKANSIRAGNGEPIVHLERISNGLHGGELRLHLRIGTGAGSHLYNLDVPKMSPTTTRNRLEKALRRRFK